MWRGGEACKKSLGTSEGGRVKGVQEDVKWLRWRVGAEVGENCLDNLGRRGRKFCSQSIREHAGDCGEDGTQRHGGGIAVYDEDFGGRSGWVLVVYVAGERGYETAFRAPSVEADVERLAEFEVPLGKRAGVEVVEEGKLGFMRVSVGGDLRTVFFVGEERQVG